MAGCDVLYYDPTQPGRGPDAGWRPCPARSGPTPTRCCGSSATPTAASWSPSTPRSSRPGPFCGSCGVQQLCRAARSSGRGRWLCVTSPVESRLEGFGFLRERTWCCRDVLGNGFDTRSVPAYTGQRRRPAGADGRSVAATQSRQNSLPSMSCITMHDSLSPSAASSRTRTAPSPTSRAHSASSAARRSSPTSPVPTRTSRCSRFLTTLPSGTRWKNSRGPTPEGSMHANLDP